MGMARSDQFTLAEANQMTAYSLYQMVFPFCFLKEKKKLKINLPSCPSPSFPFSVLKPVKMSEGDDTCP